MRNVLPIALVMGALSGFLAGLFFNFFNVPVIEWAISLEEAAASPTAEPEVGGISVSLAMQRIGQIPATMVAGVLFGAIFAGMYHLVRRATLGWNTWAWATIAGLLSFWAVSMVAQMKYPPSPPGVGEESSLLLRQGIQFLFILLSLAAVAAGCWIVRLIHQSGADGGQRLLRYLGVGAAYAVAVTVLYIAVPGNPDPIPDWAPEGMVILFRSFTLIGHLLLWLGIALGVAGYIRYQERGIRAYPAEAESARNLTGNPRS